MRMGIHTGEPTLGEEGCLGLDVVRGPRICGAAHGGQVLVSETTHALVRGDEPADLDTETASTVPVAALGLATRERELAQQAVAAVRDLETLGPSIERQVEESLRCASSWAFGFCFV